jgi:hypothetical protein
MAQSSWNAEGFGLGTRKKATAKDAKSATGMRKKFCGTADERR